jgi:hypothetical protein
MHNGAILVLYQLVSLYFTDLRNSKAQPGINQNCKKQRLPPNGDSLSPNKVTGFSIHRIPAKRNTIEP